MKKIRKNSLLFLTACVNPNGMVQTALQDSGMRLQQYLEAIRFYIDNFDFRLLVVENTGVDFSQYFLKEIQLGRLECLTFNGNNYNRILGKGYGEGLIIHHAFMHSCFLKECDYIIKVSGRHQVLNLDSIVTASEWFLNSNPHLVVCEIIKEALFATSDCYIASKSFYETFLNKRLKDCDESKMVWFEHILYQCVCDAKTQGFQFLYLPFDLDQRGVSGTLGKTLRKTNTKTKLRYFLRMLSYKIGFVSLK